MVKQKASSSEHTDEICDTVKNEVFCKVFESIKRAKLICESLSTSKASAIEEYKNALRCRLEVQYASGLLRVNWVLDADPPITRTRYGRDVCLGRIGQLLSESLKSLESRKMESALDQLLSADVLLGKVIGSMRREGKRGSSGI
jgi:hypothetical protein